MESNYRDGPTGHKKTLLIDRWYRVCGNYGYQSLDRLHLILKSNRKFYCRNIKIKKVCKQDCDGTLSNKIDYTCNYIIYKYNYMYYVANYVGLYGRG